MFPAHWAWALVSFYKTRKRLLTVLNTISFGKPERRGAGLHPLGQYSFYFQATVYSEVFDTSSRLSMERSGQLHF